MFATLSMLALLAPVQDTTQDTDSPLTPLQSTQRTGREFRRALPRPVPAGQPNIVFILADDLGVDMLASYGEGTNPACTPNLDTLAASGLLFRNAWTNPVCSPTRATVLTGNYAFRTGIGFPVGSSDDGLLLSETILPEMLIGYANAYVGKWHLAGNQGNSHPNLSGFSRFAGTIRGSVMNYFQWPKVVDGLLSITTTYATTDTADEAVAEILSLPEPFFLYVSFHAPHSPWHEPPATLCPTPACPTSFCGNLPLNPTNPELGKAMVEAMDTEIGRILAALDQVDPAAYVFFMGDNGTPGQLSEAPFLGSHAKGSLYEGGVNVPLLVRGPSVVAGESDALVASADLFATFAELGGVPQAAEDSISLVPYLTKPARSSLRTTVYAERFSPNGGAPPYASHSRAVRGERYKLIRVTGSADEFYDLALDPFETNDLLPGLNVDQQAAFDVLEARLVGLGVN